MVGDNGVTGLAWSVSCGERFKKKKKLGRMEARTSKCQQILKKEA